MCSLEDIQYWEDVTRIYRVDKDGNPIYEQDDTDGDFALYFCEEHQQEFKRWDSVQEHLKENE